MAIFRIVIGILFILEGIRIARFRNFYYELPEILFKWDLFHWIPELPSLIYLLLAILLMTSGVLIVLGYKFKISIISALVIYTYFFLLEPSYYNNHIYLLLLMSFLLMLTNADHYLSYKQKHQNGSWFHDQGIPKWQITIILSQIIIVLFYSGIAKVNMDWLSGQSVEAIIQNTGSESYKKLFSHKLTYLVITYGSLFYFLTISWLLISKKYKWFGISLFLLFQFINLFLIENGITTYIFLAAIPLFLRTDIVTAFKEIRKNSNGWLSKKTFALLLKTNDFIPKPQASNFISNKIKWTLILFFIVQLFLPLRHHFIKGYVDYTGEGIKFSWRMNSYYKSIVMFKVLVKNEITAETHKCQLVINQIQMIHLLYQPTHMKYLASYVAKERFPRIPKDNLFVSFFLACRLNTHPAGFLINFEKNLLDEKHNHIGHNEWINTEIKPVEGGRWNWIKKKAVEF